MANRINPSHLSARMQGFFGRRFSPEETQFRLYFKTPSHSIGPIGIKTALEKMASEVLRSFEKYSDRKDGYDIVARSNAKSNLRLRVNEPLCQAEMKKLLQEVEGRYHDLVDACHVAHELKDSDIPDSPLDEHLLRSKRLRNELTSVAQMLGYVPSVPPLN